eukprot:GHVT01104914.1.p1 GENE.GHVT01104914.1~~GHVT01104914.1.p1  ORF type:complete len:152 (-),score=16.85 GHVT01104914.1:337-792(-)
MRISLGFCFCCWLLLPAVNDVSAADEEDEWKKKMLTAEAYYSKPGDPVPGYKEKGQPDVVKLDEEIHANDTEYHLYEAILRRGKSSEFCSALELKIDGQRIIMYTKNQTFQEYEKDEESAEKIKRLALFMQGPFKLCTTMAKKLYLGNRQL